MKQLFLTSSVRYVVKDIIKHFSKPVVGQKLIYIETGAEIFEGDKQWLQDDKNALIDVGFNVINYTLTNKQEVDLEKDFEDIDVIYMAGGNPYHLLEQIQKANFKPFIHNFLNNGGVYIGSSAGSAITAPKLWPSKSNADIVDRLGSLDALDLVNFLILPHWGSEYAKEKYFEYRLQYAYSSDDIIIALRDNEYVYVKDDFYRIEKVSCGPTAKEMSLQVL